MYKALHQSIWVAKENPFLVGEDTGGQYIKLRDFERKVILVRDEYLELWKFVCEQHALRTSIQYKEVMGGLVITGQPGIGKSAKHLY
jgi:hypothetical protein